MRPDDELDEELAAHLRMAIAERVARGQSRRDAEWAARRELGNLTHIREVTREVHGLGWERLRQDVAGAVRALRKAPAFAGVALLTLALGIGATSAVFTVVRGVLLRPLPYADPSRLALISYVPAGLPMAVAPGVSDRAFPEFRRRTTSFERVASFARTQVTLTGSGDAVRLGAASVTEDFFAALGVSAARGRTFGGGDAQTGRAHVVVLSDALWRSRFGAAPDIIGRTLTLDNASTVVIGVAPPGFRFPEEAALWMPLVDPLDAGNSWIRPVIGRLRPGVSMARAQAELESIMRALPNEDAADRFAARVAPLHELLTESVRGSLLLLGGAVAFVLLIACVNVSNLLLIRAAGRRQEMAVRTALGAGRPRLVRQLLTESALLGLGGGVLGIAVAAAGVRILVALAPAGRLPRLDAIRLDPWVVGFTLGTALLAGIGFGLVPAFQSSTRAPREALGTGARRATERHGTMRATFAAAQVALAVILLTGAGLLIRSFQLRRAVDSGYHDAPLMTMSVDLPALSYGDAVRVRAFHTALLRGLAALPGARAVGAVAWPPLGDAGIMGDFHPQDGAALPPGYLVDKPAVSPGYFGAAGIALLRGRDFSWTDDARAPPVAVVSAAMARQVWPHAEPIGQRLALVDRPGPADWLTVIGVVGDVVQGTELVRHPTLYLPYLQVGSLFFIDHMTFVARAGDEQAARSFAPAMREALRAIDPGLVAQNVGTLRQHLAVVTAEPLFESRLLAAFAILALIVAAVGTYGVLAYDVAARRHEIAVRVALGATPRRVVRFVLTRAALIAAVGLGLGVIGSIGLTGVLRESLYGVRPTDPATFGVVIGVMVAASLAAGWVPARRAARVDPLTALAGG